MRFGISIALSFGLFAAVGCASFPNPRGDNQTVAHSDISIRYVDSSSDHEFKRLVNESVDQLLDFSRQEELNIKAAKDFVAEVVVYGSKASFDKMITSSPNWPKENTVPANYVGVGEKGLFHVVSWETYSLIHPNDARDDYKKLLTHELGHLLHIAVLKGQEDEMGPTWFFEGLACLMAKQYPNSKLPDQMKIISIMKDTERGSYQDYVAIVRNLSAKRRIKDLIRIAKNSDFTNQMQNDLSKDH